MKKLIFTLLCSAVTCLTLSVMAQPQTPPEGGTPKDFVLPAKQEVTLSNGLKAVVVPYGNIPKVVVQLIIKTGNMHEAKDQVWLADLVGMLLKEGTTSMDFKTLSQKVAGMGGEIDVQSGMNNVTISSSVLSEFAPDLIKIIGDMVINPAFPASEISRLKADLSRNLTTDKSVPQNIAAERFFQILYKDHPYGRYFPTQEMIDSFTIDMVKKFYASNYGALRSVIYVSGKFDEKKVFNAVEVALGKWSKGPEISYPAITNKYTKAEEIIDRNASPQTTIYLGLPTLMPKDKDIVALEVTNSLLGGSFGSRITSNIREDKGYTYSPRSTIQDRIGASVWYESADVTTEHTVESLVEIKKEINRLQGEPPSETELIGIKKYMAGIFVLRNSSPAGIIRQLSFIENYGLDDSYLTDRVKNIYAVTPEKVSQMTEDYFTYENMTLVMVGEKNLINQQMKLVEKIKKLK